MLFGMTYTELTAHALYRPALAVLVIVLTVIVAQIVRIIMKRSMERSAAVAKLDKTRLVFVRHFIGGIIYILGIIIAISMIPSLEKLAISLFAGAGVLALVIGLGAQKAFANIVSGVFIIIFRPFRVGDVIEVQTNLGTVEDINLRHTVIRDFENQRLVIPNAVVSEETIVNRNYNDDEICRHIVVGISYGSDVIKAMKLLQELCEKHPLCLDKRDAKAKKAGEPKVNVRVVNLGDSSVDLKAYAWAKDSSDAWILACDIRRDIKLLYDKKGIEIPFPHRTVYLKNVPPKKRKR